MLTLTSFVRSLASDLMIETRVFGDRKPLIRMTRLTRMPRLLPERGIYQPTDQESLLCNPGRFLGGFNAPAEQLPPPFRLRHVWVDSERRYDLGRSGLPTLRVDLSRSEVFARRRLLADAYIHPR